MAVLAVSAAPVAELRGGLPLALGYGFAPWTAYGLAVLGNLLPVVPLLLGLGLIERIARRWRPASRALDWVFARSRRKGRAIERYGPAGLLLLVAVPLPVTGAWTGAIAAFILGMSLRRAVPMIAAGVIIAGGIVLAASLAGFHLVGLR